MFAKLRLVLLLFMLMLVLIACQPIRSDTTEKAAAVGVESTSASAAVETVDAPSPASQAVDATTPITPTDVSPPQVEQTTAASEPTADALPVATIVVSSLRIRQGPGIDYPILGAAAQGETLSILGQARECQWLLVQHPRLGAVWISGASQFVNYNSPCSQLAAAEIPPLPTPAPAAEQPTTPPPAATAAPTATPAPAPADDPFPPGMGCYLFQNQLGPELNVTITNHERGWSTNFRVPANGEVPYCLDPGRYAVTIDAPPPWADINFDLMVHAGERLFIPVRPQR